MKKIKDQYYAVTALVLLIYAWLVIFELNWFSILVSIIVLIYSLTSISKGIIITKHTKEKIILKHIKEKIIPKPIIAKPVKEKTKKKKLY